MIRIILLFSLVVFGLIVPSMVQAEIGNSVQNFKKSPFAKEWELKEAVMTDLHYREDKGKASFHFRVQDEELKDYVIHLIAEKNGEKIKRQFLTFPYSLPEEAALRLESYLIAQAFIVEAIGKKIDLKEFSDFFFKVSISLIGQTKEISGYTVEIAQNLNSDNLADLGISKK